MQSQSSKLSSSNDSQYHSPYREKYTAWFICDYASLQIVPSQRHISMLCSIPTLCVLHLKQILHLGDLNILRKFKTKSKTLERAHHMTQVAQRVSVVPQLQLIYTFTINNFPSALTFCKHNSVVAYTTESSVLVTLRLFSVRSCIFMGSNKIQKQEHARK